MKPIEAGCMALVVNSVLGKAIGKVVHVVERDALTGHWIVEGEVTDQFGRQGVAACPESWLMRIDGGEDESVTESRDTEVSA